MLAILIGGVLFDLDAWGIVLAILIGGRRAAHFRKPPSNAVSTHELWRHLLSTLIVTSSFFTPPKLFGLCGSCIITGLRL
jgi:hypothetical protein